MTVGESASGPESGVRVATRFFPVSAALAPYCSIIYLTEVEAPTGVQIEDYLHPEWANLRFIEGEFSAAAVAGEAPQPTPPFVVAGPTSRATHFIVGPMRAWGIGFLPAGWAKFFAVPAEAVQHSARAYAERSTTAKLVGRPLRTLSVGRLLRRENVPQEALA